MLSSALIAWETYVCLPAVSETLIWVQECAKLPVKMSCVFTPWGAEMELVLTWVKSGTSCSCEELGAHPQQQQCWAESQSWLGLRNPSKSVSICRKEWFGGGWVRGEGHSGSQQKLISHKLFPLQPISGHSLLTYMFPFTLLYVCQRAIAPLTPTLLFMPSLFAHFNPVPSITAHPSSSLSSTSDSYFLICLGFFTLWGFFLTSSLPLNSPPSVPSTWLFSSIFPPPSFSCSFFLCSQWNEGHSHVKKYALSGVIPLSLVQFHHIWGSRSLEFPFLSL